ncbi:MAG: hypothetical protein ICV64_07735 [Thermoleophilia bacterium]|nr:hypothetical protein [Thermoleophilia bacterium]
MTREVTVQRVEEHQTRSGNTRWVLRDADGNEYTTFKPEIGARAREAEGRRARIEYHETQRGNWTNVYLDAVEPLEEDAPAVEGDDRAVDETAWSTAIEAAPWLLGSQPPDREVAPEELFEKLKPFKDLVAEDIGDADDAA